ncbi:MAG TPA: S9 family peptidase [Pyrinomonadaceae bacterium]|jgi:dipeptidyl aminopeptidase/acylaminoacyl peptidase|nr:S9 family peptidase [Pyrinomonadaceae bacterium]
MTPEETLRVASVSDAQISPDGSRVVYTVSVVAGNETRSSLWMALTTDPRRPLPAQVVGGELRPSRPRWSPDSRFLAFLGSRGEQAGVWVMPATGDAAPRLVAAVRSTNFFITYAGEPFAWSPDSRRIAYVSATEEQVVPQVADKSYQREDSAGDPRVIDRIQYKSRTSLADHLRTHVWVTDIASPSPRQLTFGQTYDHALTWSPRGDEIAFLSNHEPDPDANNNSDIFSVSTADGRVRQITNTRGCEYEPAWSPDGRWIAYTATTREVTTIDSVAEDAHVWITDAAGGRPRELTAEQDRRARSPQWTADGNSIYYLAGDRGRTNIYRVGVADRVILTFRMWGGERGRGEVGVTRGVFVAERLSPADPDGVQSLRPSRPSQIGNFSIASRSLPVAASRREIVYSPSVAFTLSDAVTPSEVYLAVAPSLLVRRLSAHNDQLTRGEPFVEPEELRFESFDGTEVQGWLMKPARWGGGRAPMILSIHGGPHGMSGYGFNAAFQAYAARGYAVLFINPRGSAGYGQKFSDGTLREWGGGDYKDLMAGVDAALKKYNWLDSNRMGVTGGSYGGFMTNWIVTQTPRFRAAVSSASVSNLVSFYATSLYQDLIHAEFGGFPWDDYDLLWRWSPLRYVRDAQTPTLFIHGEQDNDVHITQAEEMYTALRRRGVETVLLRYPREGHGLREPRHRLDALERTLWWFDKYLK